MISLTDKQKQTLDFILEFKRENGYAPTYREMMDDHGITIQAVVDRLKAIERKGYILLGDKHKARTIRVRKDLL